MTAPMIPTQIPNVSSQVVAQQAQPQTSALATFLLALRGQQDNEARTQIEKMQVDAQIADARQRQSALEEAHRLAQQQADLKAQQLQQAQTAAPQAFAALQRPDMAGGTAAPELTTNAAAPGLMAPVSVKPYDRIAAANAFMAPVMATAPKELLDAYNAQVTGVQSQRAATADRAAKQTVVGKSLVDAKGKVIYTESDPAVSDDASKYALFVMGKKSTTGPGQLDPRTELPRYQELVNGYRRSGTSTTNIDLGAAKGFMGQVGPELFTEAKTMQGLISDNRLVNRALKAIGAGATSGPGSTQIKSTEMLLQKMTGKRDVSAEETAVLENALLQRVLAYSATRPLAGSQSDAEGKMIADAKAGRINYNSIPALVKILLADRTDNRQKIEGYKARINSLPASSGIDQDWRNWLTKDLVEEGDTGAKGPPSKGNPMDSIQSDGKVPYTDRNGKKAKYTPIEDGAGGWYISTPDGRIPVNQ